MGAARKLDADDVVFAVTPLAFIRPVSGHRTLQQTTTYNKANESKARSAGVLRQQHVANRARAEKERT